MKRVFDTVLTLAALLCFSNGAAWAQQVRDMKILSEQAGWARTGQRLYWTNDGGAHWRDIAPANSSAQNIGGIFFLDTSRGWVVVSRLDNNGIRQFQVASTQDSGTTWSFSTIRLPWKRIAGDFDSGSDLFFLNSKHGWANLNLSHGLMAASARLLVTEDGGKTWSPTKDEPAWAASSLCFFSESDGALAGGITDETALWVTHDGSKTWQQIELKAPPETGPADQPTYGDPICKDSRHGFIPITFSGTNDSPSAFVLFATDDGGRSWKSVRVLPKLSQTSLGQKIPFAAAGPSFVVSTWIMGKPTLASFGNEGDVRRTALANPVREVRELSFADSLHGWAATLDGMYSTGDGGVTWTDITPPSGQALRSLPVLPRKKRALQLAERMQSVPQPQSQSTRNALMNAGAGPLTEVHLGFDKGSAPSVAQMQVWWDYSPYYDYQISLVGAANHPTNGNLVPNWVNRVESQGWGLWPVWVGPQAPCMIKPTKKTVFMTAADGNDAYTEGQLEAGNAINSLESLGHGLSNTIIYYDMENYDTSNSSCVAIVEGFLDGWIDGLHSNPNGYYKAGVYGNVAPAAQNFSQLSSLPDDVWIALAPETTTPPKVTIWSLASATVALCDPYSASPCNLWSNNQRMHQYVADGTDQLKYMETWGRLSDGTPVTLEIDPDIIDADVAWPSKGTKLYSYSFEQFTQTDYQDYAYAINNIGSAANYGGFINGSASDSSGELGRVLMFSSNLLEGLQSWSYSIRDWGTSLVMSPPPYPQQGNCFARQNYCTFMAGMNNAGWIVGWWTDSGGIDHGFLNRGGTLISFDAPGAGGEYPSTDATAINDAGLITGYYSDSVGYHGFIYNANTLQFIGGPLDYPGSAGTVPFGINGIAQIVGGYLDGDEWQGFLYSNGNFTAWPCGGAMPASNGAVPQAINDNDQVVGYYGGLLYGIGVPPESTYFVSYDLGSSCYTFSAPNSIYGTAVYGINDAGQISGSVLETQQSSQLTSFVAVPQTP